MSVKIVTGGIGSGKTRYCTDEIERIHNSNPTRRCVMVVPSHYSHETERMLINRFGGTGLNNIECTAFEKLARELVLGSSRHLGASGKNVLICRAIALAAKKAEEAADEFDRRLLRAIRKRGFTDVASSLISEMHRYNVSSEMLCDFAKNSENQMLSQKLRLLSLISKNYESLLSEKDYVDSDDDLSRLAGVIGKHFDSDTSIWIDKFDELLPQQLEVVKALISSGADITITFNTCSNPEDTYYGTKNAISDIKAFTDTEIIRLDGEMSHIKSPDLKFLFSSWFDSDTYIGKCENIEVFAARDAYTETEHVARKILDLVREDGYRYYDIGILCGTQNGYSHIIEAVFDEYEIPYYTDERISISEYPIAMQILALFDIIEHNWDYNSMLEYLRAGFIYTKTHTENNKIKYTRLNPDEIDLLENFVLRYGIEHKNAWSRSWLSENRGIVDTAFETEKENSQASEKLDELRRTVILPVENYNRKITDAKTVSDYCRALFGFLEDINLYQGLKNELLSMAINNATADAQRFGQIWNLVLDVLDQVDTALAEEIVTHSEFAEYIRAAMEKCQIRTIPSGIDRVFIGSADMNRALPTPIVFMMGAVSGTFPAISTSEGFLSNADRTTLSDNSIRFAPTTHKKAEKERNTVYKLLSAVMDKLYISYPTMTISGDSNLPSQTVTDIMSRFSDIRVSDDIISDDTLHISTPKATLHNFLMYPKSHPLWPHISSWFEEHDEWRNRLFTVKNAKNRANHRKIELNSDIAQELYRDKNRYSATRLNSWASCPFSHFMQYGLDAREREEYDIKPTDTGTYAHEIIRRFCEKVDTDSSINWDNISDDMCTEIVSGIVSDTLDKIRTSELRDKEMTADILSRMGTTVTEAAKTVCRSIKCGQFNIESYEKEVYVNLTDDIQIGGIIDRLDVCRMPESNEYRIIDYKTGNKDFSVSDVYHGLDMQPVIYALAMRMLDDKATVSGMYYSMVHNNFASIDVTSKESTALSQLRKNTAYNGITFVGNNKNSPIPTDEINRIESELSRAEGSLFFTGKADKFGYSKSVRTRPDGEWLMGRVHDNIINADKNIRNGSIDLSPLVNGTNHACTYCAYKSVCKFDEAEKNERCVTESDNDIWNKIEEDA